jgi:hypothetical protein
MRGAARFLREKRRVRLKIKYFMKVPFLKV